MNPTARSGRNLGSIRPQRISRGFDECRRQ